MINHKDDFVVKVVVKLGFIAMKSAFPAAAGILSFIEPVAGFFARKFLGFLIGYGIATIDFTNDTINVARQSAEWKDDIDLIYNKTQERVYNEEEKEKIRKQYLAALRKYAGIGNGPAKPN